MDISSLAVNKGLLIKGFASLSGISGASSASWYFYDSINQTGYSKFFKAGYKFAPTVFYSDVTTLDLTEATKEEDKVNRFNTNSNICVEKYISPDVIGNNFYESNSNGQSISDLNYSSLESSSVGSDIKGCIAMKLSTNGQNFIFESETVVENGQYALVIWSSSWNFKKILLENKVILLKKESDSWNIKGGFVLSADSLSKVEIKSPDSSISSEFSSTTNATTTSGSWSYQYYLGIWENDSSGADFKNLMSWERTGSVNHIASLSYILPTTQSRYVYDAKNKKWGKKDEDVESVLTKWFELLKDKKGKWNSNNNLSDDCKNKSLIRNIDEKTEKFLEKYCFKRS